LKICGDIHSSRCTTSVVDTSGKWKNLQSESLKYLVWTPLGSRGVSILILFPLFATSINNTSVTGGKFTAGVVDTGGAPSLMNISVNFRHIFEITIMLFSVAWGKMFHEENLT
jgi:hypothetical protein